MEKIILDTDFILHCVRAKVDIKEELFRILDFPFEVYILDKTLEELKGKKQEKVAREVIKSFKIIKTEEGKVDDLLQKQEGIIATTDKELKEKLKKSKKRIIFLRQKKFLKLD